MCVVRSANKPPRSKRRSRGSQGSGALWSDSSPDSEGVERAFQLTGWYCHYYCLLLPPGLPSPSSFLLLDLLPARARGVCVVAAATEVVEGVGLGIGYWDLEGGGAHGVSGDQSAWPIYASLPLTSSSSSPLSPER